MDSKFSEFAGRLEPSAIRGISKAVHGRQAQGKAVISFAGGMPHPDTFPVAELRRIAGEVLGNHAPDALQYGLTQGYPALIEQVILHLAGRGITGLKPENVLIAAGSQQALDLVGRIFIDPGHTVLMESPGYVGAIAAFRNLGARLVGIPILEEGPDLERLESALRREKPGFFYFSPNFSNPTGALTSLEKRRAVYALARQYDLWIVEDDAYGELYFDECSPGDVVPLKADDPDGRVVYLHTFSKTIAPGLRLAAVVGPEPAVSLMEMAKQAADMFTSSLSQRLAAELFREGSFRARLPRLRAFYQARRDAMAAALRRFLPESRWKAPRGGFFLWVEFPGPVDAAELLEAALEVGVAYVPGAPFYTTEEVLRGTARLAFSRETEADIASGIKALGGILEGALRAIPR